MSYATATELLIRFDSDEISQRADRMVPRLVTDEMLRIAAAGGDLSGFSPEERAAIARAMERSTVRWPMRATRSIATSPGGTPCRFRLCRRS